MLHEIDLVVIDDSGLLGLVDGPSYKTFVSEEWTYEQLMSHFAAEMQRGSVLVWDCADGGNDYRVRVRAGLTNEPGFREISGSITATSDRLHLASYTALTMAAQFREYGIPDKHEAKLAIPVVPGTYKVRIVQMYDPSELDQLDERPHFVLELEPGDAPRWFDVAWRAA